ncbi:MULTISPECIES: hypothetical protein [Burkholderia cepacia complex]|uniref:hypothetical protein n=1 Tax=Burkholderia cepacia complex TaxID=87882 RepID=UPI000841D2C2|nr:MULTISPECIES: hypothetical protein [Burkholderia cepacia complex]AOK04051.1 hypothetical protein WK25_05955 [Burkholderia latens]
MLTIPKTKKALTHAVMSRTGARMGAHPSEALALEQAAKLNESRKFIDRLNGPYRVAPYRA